MISSWKDQDKVAEYTGRVGRLAARQAGEMEMLEALPAAVTTVVDLGCGDGRLIELVLDAHPELTEAIGLDNSPPMLDLARQRFAGQARVRITEHDLDDALAGLHGIDAVVSGFAIHHLSHERKRTLFGEILASLRPGGVFANLEVVQCATAELHEECCTLPLTPFGANAAWTAPVVHCRRWGRPHSSSFLRDRFATTSTTRRAWPAVRRVRGHQTALAGWSWCCHLPSWRPRP